VDQGEEGLLSVKTNINIKQIYPTSAIENITIKIITSNKTIYFLLLYIPPKVDKLKIDELYDLINSVHQLMDPFDSTRLSQKFFPITNVLYKHK